LLYIRRFFSIFTAMPPAKNPKSAGMYERIIRAISTPLGFYVLSLLIVEATIGLVLTASKLSEDHVWWGFFMAIGLFLLVFIMVTVLVIWFPKKLLYGKEEHSNPALEPSASRDAIEEIVTAIVKTE
jgi:heme A synthase